MAVKSPALDFEWLAAAMEKPLRPDWIVHGSAPELEHPRNDVYRVVLISASEAVPEGMEERPGFYYVQGSGDDEETWSIQAASTGTFGAVLNCGAPHSGELQKKDDGVVHGPELGWGDHGDVTFMYLPIPEGSKGSYALRAHLAAAVEFLRASLADGRKALVHCAQGRDRSVCVALAFLVEFMRNDGRIEVDRPADKVSNGGFDEIDHPLAPWKLSLWDYLQVAPTLKLDDDSAAELESLILSRHRRPSERIYNKLIRDRCMSGDLDDDTKSKMMDEAERVSEVFVRNWADYLDACAADGERMTRNASVWDDLVELWDSVPDLHQKYRLLDKSGSGTFSSVYKASDIHHAKHLNPWCPAHSQEKVSPSDTIAVCGIVAIKAVYVTASTDRVFREFSIVKQLSKKSIKASRAGTRGFRPPEVLFREPHQTTAVDIWAVGVILLCMLTGCYPFFISGNDNEALLEIANMFGKEAMHDVAPKFNRTFRTNITTVGASQPLGEIVQMARTLNATLTNSSRRRASGSLETPPPPPPVPPEAIDFLTQCLALDPAKRITAVQALEHPFLAGVADLEGTPRRATGAARRGTKSKKYPW
ncbi:Cell division control protein 7 [Cladochytrium tenue]|nr:Cell division control protein 7 [Cladochytrium tenue]